MGSLDILSGLLFAFIFLHICCATEFASLRKISVQVCPDGSSGTGDTIYIELVGKGRSTSCTTKWNGGYWNTAGKEVIEGAELGNCTRFYPTSSDGQGISDTIELRVLIDDALFSGNLFAWGYDALQLCSIIVEFGDANQTWYAYEWTGSQWWEENKGQLISLRRRSVLFVERITAKVCPDSYSGTDDTIHIEIDDGHNSCKTRTADDWGNNWGTSYTEVLDGQALDDCRILNPKYDYLNLRVSIDNSLLSDGWAIGYDAIQLCSVQVDFREHKVYDGVSYIWTGTQWWEENAGPFISLRKVGKSIDGILAPNSYNAEVVAYPWNNYLSSSALTFENIAPTMVINGIDTDAPPRIVEWNELRNNHQDGHFNQFVRLQLAGVLKSAEKLVIVTHGWKDGDIMHCDRTWVTEFAQKIGKHQNDIEKGRIRTATIALCWNSQPLPHLPFVNEERVTSTGKLCYLSYISFRFAYYNNAATTGKVGELLGKLITAIKTEYPNIKYVHGIGHSLGAHVMGNIFNFGGVKINRISGLDPAGPCFEKSARDIQIKGRSWGLNKGSAYFVDNIHSDGGYYGTYLSKGDIDIFAGDPNEPQSGAGLQPTCSSCLAGCCHGLAPQYYLYSIRGSEETKFYTSYVTQSQDENRYEARNIGPTNQHQRIHAGYHVDPAIISTQADFKGRMFLPIFNVNGHWYPICDTLSIPEREHHWCKNVAG